jgi:hypothetical protein
MILKLKGVGNPDLQQNAMCRQYAFWKSEVLPKHRKKRWSTSKWNLGGGNLVAGIFDKRRNGRRIAHVSYNGKAWKIPD